MKHIAVVGTGTIGLMLSAFLTRGGYDVTVVPQFRAQLAEQLRKNGITVTSGSEKWNVAVKAVYAGALEEQERFDWIFLTGKSNDTDDALDKLLPHLAEDGCVVSLQNGINEDRIVPRAGAAHVMACVCFAGGQCPEPTHVITHEGTLIVGELSGERTRRVEELAAMLSCVKTVEIASDIMAVRWRKLSEVCLTVPAACVAGYPLFSGFEDRRMQKLFGRLAVEVMAVEQACGVKPEPIMGLNAAQWDKWSREDDPELEALFFASNRRPAPPKDAPGPIFRPEDAYTQDIHRGRPLEVWYTNGYLVEKAREKHIEAPMNERLLAMIRQIEAGQRQATPENLEQLLEEQI